MKHFAFPIIAALLLSGCTGDETLTKYGAAGKTWHLKEIDGTRFPAKATLIFDKPGEFGGQAPCNLYGGSQTAVYPWFKASDVIATQIACDALPQESKYFAALESMTVVEITGDTLILTNDAGGEMLFKAGPADQ